MSGFSPEQLKKLIGRLDQTKVHSREINGRQIDYIEGWFAIAEANAIFGYSGWDREMVHFEQVFERKEPRGIDCAYVARVRVRVRAGGQRIVREGTGFGHGFASLPADAYERALKAAETDATKRALATFGNRFGLSLYDKEQKGAARTVGRGSTSHGQADGWTLKTTANTFLLKTDAGTVLASELSPAGFCSGLRQLIEAARNAEEVEGLKCHNDAAIALLRETAPDLKSGQGKHYADILAALMEKRGKALREVVTADSLNSDQITLGDHVETVADPVVLTRPSRIAPGPAIDKSVLAIASTRRIRNKGHLIRVGAEPCLLCEQGPAHAHHVTFAQPRGLSVKVSDEFVVPLCAVHHNELHRAGNEAAWWRKAGIDPLVAAQALWLKSLVLVTPDMHPTPN